MEKLFLRKTLLQIVELLAEISHSLKNQPNPYEPIAPPRNNEELLTRQQVKEFLNIEETTYKRKVKAGILKPIKMPGGDRFYKSDLIDAYNESIRRGRI
ncbi:MAG: helix-turn-helix transcriptional regulator [Bacteroidia bacterium]